MQESWYRSVLLCKNSDKSKAIQIDIRNCNGEPQKYLYDQQKA